MTGLPPGDFLDQTGNRCRCGHDHAASFVPFLNRRPPPAPGRATDPTTEMLVSFKHPVGDLS